MGKRKNGYKASSKAITPPMKGNVEIDNLNGCPQFQETTGRGKTLMGLKSVFSHVVIPLLSAYLGVWGFQKQEEYRQQQSFKNEMLGRTVEILYQLEGVAEEIIESRDLECAADEAIKAGRSFDLYTHPALIDEDRMKIFRLNNEMNMQLGKLFAFVNDETYAPVHAATASSDPSSLKLFREQALIAIRKGEFPGTVYAKNSDIHVIKLMKTKCHK